MTINLPNDVDIVVQQKAAAAGFGDDINAYVAHLIVSDQPAQPLSEDELAASLEMIRQGEQDIAAGRTQPMREALQQIAEQHGLKINK